MSTTTSIAPTVTAENAHTYRTQMERLAPFATRVHIDVMDGHFAPTKSINLDQVWWPGGVRADLHMMIRNPFQHVELYRALGPTLVIVHAEAKGDFVTFAQAMHRHGIETGVALLQQTAVETIAPALELIDHVLVFSGDLGHFGGRADLRLLQKVEQLRRLKPTLEIGWDGGINGGNARQLAEGGVDVLNVGGYIQRADDPEVSYETLRNSLGFK
jgi:ribulose-phosphate 3-epimerase